MFSSLTFRNCKMFFYGRIRNAQKVYSYINYRRISSTACVQAGHSKYANIKHIKAKKDGERALIFTKLTRKIRLAIQEGGSNNPQLNAKLRNVIDEALKRNMPMSTIENNIKKSNKGVLKRNLVGIRYKQKVFAVVVCYTDNFASLKMEMATILRKSGALMADVHHLFEEHSVIEASLKKPVEAGTIEERLMEAAIECGADDVEVIDPNRGLFYCNPLETEKVCRAMENSGYNIEHSESVFVTNNKTQLSLEEEKPYNDFLTKLRNVSGVEDIYDNIESSRTNE